MKPDTEEFIRIICTRCLRLLARVSQSTVGEIELKCKRCGNTRLIHLPLVAKCSSEYDERDIERQ